MCIRDRYYMSDAEIDDILQAAQGYAKDGDYAGTFAKMITIDVYKRQRRNQRCHILILQSESSLLSLSCFFFFRTPVLIF